MGIYGTSLVWSARPAAATRDSGIGDHRLEARDLARC